MPLSVGHVLILSKMGKLLLFTIGLECGLQALKMMVSLRLNKIGNAPLMFSSDTRIFRARRTLKKFGSFVYLGFLMTALISFALVPADMMWDAGAAVRHDCKAEKIRTIGICAAGNKRYKIEKGGTQEIGAAFLVTSMPWNDEHLSKYGVQQGLRKELSGTEYFGASTRRNPALPYVAANCSVSMLDDLNAQDYKLKFSFGEDNGAYLDSIISKGREYEGLGAFTDNYHCYSAFIVVPGVAVQGMSASVIEYPSSSELSNVERIVKQRGTTVFNPSKNAIRYTVSCLTVGMHPTEFALAIYAYRYVQLSRSIHRKCIVPHVGAKSASTRRKWIAPPLNSSDIVRAVIGAKIGEEQVCPGETLVFTECGDYAPLNAIPLLSLVLILAILAIVFTCIFNQKKGELVVAPITAVSWSKYAKSTCEVGKRYVRVGSPEYARYAEVPHKNWISEYILEDDPENEGKRRLGINRIIILPKEENSPSLFRKITSINFSRMASERLSFGRSSNTNSSPGGNSGSPVKDSLKCFKAKLGRK